jgi:hypothetical protein
VQAKWRDALRRVPLIRAYAFALQSPIRDSLPILLPTLRQGLLAPSLWLGWEQVIMNFAGAPGGRAFWKERAYLFGEEFRRHVEDDLMKRTPHPDAKPMGAFRIGRSSE